MSHPVCYTSSSLGPCPNLGLNFKDRPESVSMTWDDGFNFEDDSWFRVFHQCEPPDVLDVIDKLIANQGFYDLILAFNDRVLKECPNAVFITESACSWIDRKAGKLSPFPWGMMRVDGYDKPQSNPVVEEYSAPDVNQKEFRCSFITSNKAFSSGHKLRLEIFDRLPQSINNLEILKHKSPPRWNDKRTMLENYMFHVAVENSRHNNYYSEKLVDCFMSKTFPLYWGCHNLHEHFNPDGFMFFENYGDLESKLKLLTPEFYKSRLGAIEDNYQRALRGVHQWDLMEYAIDCGIEKKKRLNLQHEPPRVASPKPRSLREPYRPLCIAR